jgi:hypothetical protein
MRKQKEIVFRKLAYGRTLFDEKFWIAVILFLKEKKSKKEKEGIVLELLPYMEELKRIYQEGADELVMLTEYLVAFLQKENQEIKDAWFNFCKLLLPDFVADLPGKTRRR